MRNNTPPTVELISPENDTKTSVEPTLKVKYKDEDGEKGLDGSVIFYDASDDTIIGQVNDVSNGTIVDVEWSNLSPETDYSWYVVANDTMNITTSDIWFITTNNPPNISLVSPDNTSVINDFIVELKANYSDYDNDTGNISFYSLNQDKESWSMYGL